MKRLNPNTNQPFKRGDVREDGYLFKGYKTKKVKQTGFFSEEWLHPDNFLKIKLRQDTHYIKNKAYHLTRCSKNKLNNRALYTALQAKRRSAQLQRTPKWLTANQIRVMQAFYQIAAMLSRENNEPWHVDHIIPLQGKNVSGLHVPSNLRVIPGSENVKKSNKYAI